MYAISGNALTFPRLEGIIIYVSRACAQHYINIKEKDYINIKEKEKGAYAHRDAPCIKPIISEAIGSGRK